MFNVDGVVQNFTQSVKEAALPGFRALLTMIDADPEITDPRWAAYMLATVRWECAQRWEPIEEFGRGRGHEYGQPVTVNIQGAKFTNAYYGRGYVQLTWEGDYATMSHALGLGNLLITNPEHVLERPIAYKVMSFGMRHGSFTGASLHRFISDTNCDYVQARKIINGLDQANMIAGYAREFENLLMENQDAAAASA